MSIDHRTGRPFNVHYHRMHRSARHIVRHMRRASHGYTRAGVLVAQVRALEYAVSLRDTSPSRLPSQASVAAGQRVRIGHDTRELLDRLSISRNLRVQQALVKEISAQVRKRIKIHRDRSRLLKTARTRTSQAVRAAGAPGRAAGRAVSQRVRTYHDRHVTRTARVPAREGQPARPRSPLAIEQHGRPMPDDRISRGAARVRRRRNPAVRFRAQR